VHFRRSLLIAAAVAVAAPAGAAAKGDHVFKLTVRMINYGSWSSHGENQICSDRRLIWDGEGSYGTVTRQKAPMPVRMTDSAKPRFTFPKSKLKLMTWPRAGKVQPFKIPVGTDRNATYKITKRGLGQSCQSGFGNPALPSTKRCGERTGTAQLLLYPSGTGLRLFALDLGDTYAGECPAESQWAGFLPTKQPGTAGAIKKLRNRKVKRVTVKVRSTSVGTMPWGIGSEDLRGRQTGKLSYTLIFQRANRAKG
jgi:hypothetical protein